MRGGQLYDSLIPTLWIAWTLYWWISSAGTKTTQRSESLSSRLWHIVPLMIGVILIVSGHISVSWLSIRLLPWTSAAYWTGVVLLALGLAFTVWARRHLGRNWSATVTLKEGHQLIRTGPYRWVRHPIYTGLLIALLGSAIARGELRAVIGLVIVAAAFIRKLRIEERWMCEHFKEEYERYSAAVPALIPGIL
jgi:protein-S-isoprenylcysteine O-methyltransferase Ste14